MQPHQIETRAPKMTLWGSIWHGFWFTLRPFWAQMRSEGRSLGGSFLGLKKDMRVGFKSCGPGSAGSLRDISLPSPWAPGPGPGAQGGRWGWTPGAMGRGSKRNPSRSVLKHGGGYIYIYIYICIRDQGPQASPP